MKNIILISGKARHGKDQIAKYIKEQLELENKKVITIAYGDYVKEIATKYFNWNGKKDEQGRQLIQYIGTDLVRTKLNMPNFWVNHVINLVKVVEVLYDYVIITDCRFPNEIDIVKNVFQNKAISIRIKRDKFITSLNEEQQKHPSETSLDDYKFDYYIENNGSLNDLKYKASQVLNTIKTNQINVNTNRVIPKNTKVKVIRINNLNKASHLQNFIGEKGKILTNFLVKDGIRRYKVLFKFGEECETAYFRDSELELL